MLEPTPSPLHCLFQPGWDGNVAVGWQLAISTPVPHYSFHAFAQKKIKAFEPLLVYPEHLVAVQDEASPSVLGVVNDAVQSFGAAIEIARSIFDPPVPVYPPTSVDRREVLHTYSVS